MQSKTGRGRYARRSLAALVAGFLAITGLGVGAAAAHAEPSDVIEFPDAALQDCLNWELKSLLDQKLPSQN